MKNKILSKQILILTLINVVPILLLIIFIVDLKEAVLSLTIIHLVTLFIPQVQYILLKKLT